MNNSERKDALIARDALTNLLRKLDAHKPWQLSAPLTTARATIAHACNTLSQLIEQPAEPWTNEDFLANTGHPAGILDLVRVNGALDGTLGHAYCGVCPHNLPRFNYCAQCGPKAPAKTVDHALPV